MYYSRTTISTVVSTASTYADPIAKTTPTDQTSTPSTWFHQLGTVAVGKAKSPSFVLDVSSTYLNLVPSSVIVSNKGAYPVTLSCWSKVADLAHPSAGISFGGGYITDDTSGSTYFENVEVGDCLYSPDAGNAYNRKLFLVSHLISSGVAWPKRIGVSLYDTAMATHAGDDAASFIHLSRIKMNIEPGSFAHVPGGLADLDLREHTGASAVGAQFNELQFYATGGESSVEVFVTGT